MKNEDEAFEVGENPPIRCGTLGARYPEEQETGIPINQDALKTLEAQKLPEFETLQISLAIKAERKRHADEVGTLIFRTGTSLGRQKEEIEKLQKDVERAEKTVTTLRTEAVAERKKHTRRTNELHDELREFREHLREAGADVDVLQENRRLRSNLRRVRSNYNVLAAIVDKARTSATKVVDMIPTHPIPREPEDEPE